MENHVSILLSPINKIDIHSPSLITEKNLRNKMKKIRKIKMTESLLNKYDNSEFNNSLSRTKDISYHSISRNNNINNMGYLFKSILNQKQNNMFINTYHNEKFTKNLNNNLSKLINDKSPTILFDFLTNTNSLNVNKTYNNNNNNNKDQNKSISNIEKIPSYIDLSEKKNYEKNPIKLQKIESKLDFDLLNTYYDKLTESNIKIYTSNFPKSHRIIKHNYTNGIDNYSNRENKQYNSLNLSPVKGRRVSMKSVIDRIENIEKRNSLLMNIETKKTKIITKEKKKRKVYPDYRRVSQFDLIPKFKKKIIKKKFLYSNKKTLNNSPINLIKNHFVISRKDPNKTYRLPENLLEVRQRLGKDIKKLVNESLKSNYNITNDQILYSLEKTQKSEYTKDIIEKIKIINYFLSTFPKEKFESELLRHRKVFVIIDGTVVFNEEIIKGEFIDIPTRRYLSFLESKKERLEEYYKFLSKCQQIFRFHIPFQNIFLLNGINIFDLIEIPDSDNCLFVSASNIFRGIHLFWEDQINTENVRKKDYKLLKIQECKRLIIKFRKPKIPILRKRKKKGKKFSFKKIKKDYKIFPSIIKKKKYLEDSSFTFGLTDIKYLEGEEKFIYYSDDEKKKKLTYKNFIQNHPSLLQQLIFFNEKEKEEKIEKTEKKNQKKIENFLSKRVNENTFKGLDYLIRRYNEIRGKRDKIVIHQNMKSVLEKMENDVKEETKGLFSIYLNKLNILNKDLTQTIEIDEDRFYDKEKNLKEKLQKSIIHKNIIEINEIEHHVNKEMNKNYPDLISMNIPAILKVYPKLKRRIFYDIFIQYKNLLTLCVCVNKDLKQIKKGLDFSTFFNCLPQMKTQGKSQAMKLYKTLNKLNTDYLNWEEFMQGMLSMKSNNISDKIDIFFHVIDSDGNGLLSFDEVYEISKKSLQRTLGDKNDDDDDVVNQLSLYFANLIFQLVDMPIDEEIPMDKIKEKILEGQSAAGYLEMFICADSFT